MTYWEMFSDPWATVDEQINRAQAAAGQVADTAYGYTPMGLYEAYAPSSETVLKTIDDYTYTPWEMSNDLAELAAEQAEKLNPLNFVPEINWGRVAIVVGVIAVSGTAMYWVMKR